MSDVNSPVDPAATPAPPVQAPAAAKRSKVAPLVGLGILGVTALTAALVFTGGDDHGHAPGAGHDDKASGKVVDGVSSQERAAKQTKPGQMESDARVMAGLQEAWLMENDGRGGGFVVSEADNRAGGITVDGQEPFTPAKGNTVVVSTVKGTEEFPDGGYCVKVSNPAAPNPVFFDSLVGDVITAPQPGGACQD